MSADIELLKKKKNFSSLQCNEPRTEDAPAADISLSNSTALGKKGLEAGWYNSLVDINTNLSAIN